MNFSQTFSYRFSYIFGNSPNSPILGRFAKFLSIIDFRHTFLVWHICYIDSRSMRIVYRFSGLCHSVDQSFSFSLLLCGYSITIPHV